MCREWGRFRPEQIAAILKRHESSKAAAETARRLRSAERNASVLEEDVCSYAEVRLAFQQIHKAVRRARPDARIRGFLVQEMVRGGTEVFVGGRVHPELGPLVTFGTGGLEVEVEGDVVLAEAPLSEAAAAHMIQSTRVAKRLNGFRGRPAGDIPALVKALVTISQLLADHCDGITELDVNPLVVLPYGKGVVAVDALMLLRQNGTTSEPAHC